MLLHQLSAPFFIVNHPAAELRRIKIQASDVDSSLDSYDGGVSILVNDVFRGYPLIASISKSCRPIVNACISGVPPMIFVVSASRW
jgi:hypothetical protein